MPLKVTSPVIREFPLERSDLAFGNEGEPTKITIRQATQDQNELRSYIYSKVTQILNAQSALSQELHLQQSWSIEELKRKEVWLTLVGSNILDVDGASPLFKFKQENGNQVLDMSENEFKKAWGKLQPEICAEIHEKVLEVNHSWQGPLGNML